MLKTLRCPRGHKWKADVLPPAVGETTRVLPVCPKCGEMGAVAENYEIADIAGTPTSKIFDDEPKQVLPATSPDGALPTIPGYELLDEIGRGGMGVVYRAMDRRRQSIVAVKLLPRLDPAAVLRFKHEFRALADLQHTNLACVFELGNADGCMYLVMEHVEGTPFTDYILAITDPIVRLEKLRSALGQLVDGLQHLHANGLLHCDVKPGNVFVTPQERVVLLDFGLVTALEKSFRAAGDLVGSIGYIAPERYQGKPATAASDWYAVGIMLFEILTGERPFSGERTRLIWQHQYFDPPAPIDRKKDIPEDWNEVCHALLQRDPASRPDGAAIRLRLKLAQHASSTSIQGDAPLFGRDDSLASMRSCYQIVQQGAPTLLRITGLSGMGKTTLVERFLDLLQRRETAWIFRSRCHENENMPFKGVDGLIDELAQLLMSLSDEERESIIDGDITALARAFPVMRRVKLAGRGWRAATITNPEELRRSLVSGLNELLNRLAARRPLVLFIDDFQWSDIDSIAMIGELWALPNPPNVLWIISYRQEDAQASCLRMLDAQLAQRNPQVASKSIELASLSDLDAEALIQTLLSDIPAVGEEWGRRIAREAKGWPVHVHELCRFVRQQFELGSLHESMSDLTLTNVIGERLRRLSAAERRLVEVAAVAGQPVAVDLAIAAAELPPSDRSSLASLRRQHWLRGLPGAVHHQIECAHATIRETVMAIMPADRQIEHHERLARAYMGESSTEPELLGAHLLAAGLSAEAADYYIRAADRATEKLAFDRAAYLYRLGLDLKPPGHSDAESLMLRLAQSLAHAGRGAEAAQTFLHASKLSDRSKSLQLRRLAAYHYCTSGHMTEGISLLHDVLQSHGLATPSSPGRMRAALAWERLRQRWRGNVHALKKLDAISLEDLERTEVCWAATASTSLYDVVAGAYHQCVHLRHATGLGEPIRLVRALAWEAGHLSTEGPATSPRTGSLLAEAKSIVGAAGGPHLDAHLQMVAGIVAHNRGEWQAARTSLIEAEEIYRNRCVGVSWERATTHAFLFWSLFQLGAYGVMRDWTHRLMREARNRGDRFAATNIATFALPLEECLADRPNQAREIIHQHIDDWTLPGFHLQHLTALWSECRVDLYEGHAGEGYDRLMSAWPAIRKAELLRVQTIRITLQALKSSLLAALNDKRRIDELRECENELRREGLPWAAAHAAVARSATAALQNDTSSRRSSLLDAQKMFESQGMAGHVAAVKFTLDSISDSKDERRIVGDS